MLDISIFINLPRLALWTSMSSILESISCALKGCVVSCSLLFLDVMLYKYQWSPKKKSFSRTTVQKHQFFSVQDSLWSNSHIHTWLLEKTIALTIWTFFDKGMSLLFNMLSRFSIVFLPRSKCLLISSFIF